MHLEPGHIALTVIHSVLAVSGTIAGTTHARYSRWALVVALGFGMQVVLIAYMFLPVLAPRVPLSPWWGILIDVYPYAFWAGILAILTVSAGVVGILLSVRSNPARRWGALVGAGVALHLCLLAGLEMASRLHWHATRYGRPLGILGPVVSWGHAGAQLAVIVGVFGVLLALRNASRETQPLARA